MKLSAIFIKQVKARGFYSDDDCPCLYLLVDENGSKRWVARLTVQGRRTDIGLGGASWVSLAEAREQARQLRKVAKQGGDPVKERRKETVIIPAYEAVAQEVHKSLVPTFRNKKHAAQWINTQRDYVFPTIGKMPVDKIEPKEILAMLSPIWIEKAETAQRIKQRIKVVFDYAKAKGWRSADNPVEGIAKVLPKHNGKTKEHFAALAYVEVPAFIQTLRTAKVYLSIKGAFEFLILTAARTSEVMLAKWPEINFETATWTIPAERMKAKVEHRVPLSARCLEILQAAKDFNSEFVFPGRKHGKPLSNMSFLMTLRRMSKGDITAHGFRSSFRDWAEEKTHEQRSVVEAALAHTVENKVEAAYLRTTLFEKRRGLMDLWAAFCMSKPAEEVVKIRA